MVRAMDRSATAAADTYAHATALPPIDGLLFRHLRAPDDYPAMNAVANRVRAADGEMRITSDTEFAEFYDHLPHCDPKRDVVVATIDDEVVGYGRTTSERTVDAEHAHMHNLIGCVDPAWRRMGIGRALQATLEARAGELAASERDGAPVVLRVEAEDVALGIAALVKECGYVPVRYWFTMRRPTLDDQVPAPPLPEGLEIREVEPGHLRAIWEAEAEAVLDHWGNSEVSDEDYLAFLATAKPEATRLWRVAWDGDQVAGQVRSYIDEALNAREGFQRAWVENITVRRPWRRRGLARALIAASFPRLRERGMTEGVLGVDTENPSGALGLYASMGFEPISRSTTWEKRLE
jgi:ribosomal protein S18 acetylase RimI-like enzyme